jgi:hypothetical protein
MKRDRLLTFALFFVLIVFILRGTGVHIGVLFFLWVGVFNLFDFAVLRLKRRMRRSRGSVCYRSLWQFTGSVVGSVYAARLLSFGSTGLCYLP